MPKLIFSSRASFTVEELKKPMMAMRAMKGKKGNTVYGKLSTN
jgi:hypothetical protein